MGKETFRDLTVKDLLRRVGDLERMARNGGICPECGGTGTRYGTNWPCDFTPCRHVAPRVDDCEEGA